MDYEALATPCDLDLEVISHAQEPIGSGFTVHHLYVPCKEVKKKLLPLDANPREPALAGGQVQRIMETLREHPEDFVKLNNGITALADLVTFNVGVCTIRFGEKQGVCNGGHTYFSIVTSPEPLEDSALVHIELIEFPKDLSNEQRLSYAAAISQARNNNVQLKLRSQADFLGYYEWFKTNLTNARFVSWHENDSDAVQGAISAELFIRYLSALDMDQYYHPVWHPNANDRHRTPVQSSSSPHSAWFHRMDNHVRQALKGLPPLGELAVLGDDLFAIRDFISLSLRQNGSNDNVELGQFRKTALYQDQMGEEKETSTGRKTSNLRPLPVFPPHEGCALAPTLEVLLIGLFRTNIWVMYDRVKNVRFIGWYKEPLQLWRDRAKEVLRAIADDYRDQGNDMTGLIRVKSPYTNDLFSMVAQRPPDDPEVIYDAWSGHRFELEREVSKATHYLIAGGNGGLIERASTHSQPEGSFTYRKTKDGSVRNMWTPKD